MSGLLGGSGSGSSNQQAMNNVNNPSTSQQFNSPRSSTLLDAIVRHVFEEDLRRHSFDNLWSELPDYGSIQTLLRLSLENKGQEQLHSNIVAPWSSEGRLGPDRVQFDVDSSVGSFMINNDRLGLNSQDNFSTIHANTCIYKGKWQYELMLGTKGVMQVGWATKTCQFSQEKGVGDTADSYAYDGNRQRKWNVATYKYGEMWQCGDIISCTMDLDEGVVHFFRNGRDLGAAFANVKTGPGVAYFPAVSLALGENLIINFGATPFRYPQPGYCPLEAPPTTSLLRAHSSFTWLHRLINLTINWHHYSDLVSLEATVDSRRESSLLLVAQHISTHLGPLLAMPYVVEACLVPTLYHVVGIHDDQDDSIASLNLPQAHVLFNLLMGSLEDHELLKCLENLIICLLTGHKQASESIKFRGQKRNLRLLYVLLTHDRLRKYCLKHILFDKVRFPSFVNMKAVDEEGLSSVVPSVWWTSKDNSLQHGDKAAYDHSIDTIRVAVQEVESIQMSILKLLMQLEDGLSYEDSSRALFLAKFRTFLKEHAPGSRVPVMQTPLPVILCLFQRLLSVFLELWNAQGGDSAITIPPHLFYDGQINYFDTHRLGGLESHLMKTLKEDRENALKLTEQDKILNKLDSVTASATGPSSVVDVDMFNSQPSTSGAVLGSTLVTDEGVENKVLNLTELSGEGEKNLKGSNKDRNSLLYLLDGIILLYHIGAHKQLGKVAAQRDSMNDNITHIQEIDKKIQYCKDQNLNGALLNELEGSRGVFIDKVVEQARQQAWVLAALHSQHKHHHLIQLINIILTTLQKASKEGELFAFVPDFYVESLTEMCTALRLYFTTSLESLPGYQSLLTSVGEFLALHFCDSRIVYADSKDSLIQALAGFVCHQTTLTALENMPQESRLQMVRNLLQPYENRAWAQNNWILVRFWKGCGFGFRYTKSPHMTNKFGPKPAHSDNPNFTQATAPCPSMVFQQHVVEVLEGPGNIATPFLNSLLNQLNWAFSEFIGMLQEIQNASNRPERVFIDSRQLRICATCFDLALALLRVLEMIVNIDPQLFTNFARPDAELLLSRLCQLLCQVLNRVSGWSGCFGHVVSLEIPGLETIHHYPILTAVTGILVTLVKQDLQQSNPKNQVASRTLLNEPSFQLNSIYQLLGGQENSSKIPDAIEPFRSPQGDTSNNIDAAASSSSTTATPIEESEAMLLASGAATGTDLESSSVSLAAAANTISANGQGGATATSATNANFSIKFSLRNYPGEVLSSEIDQVEQIVSHLATCMESQSELLTTGQDDDLLCTICYAYPSCAIFHPCAHTSCRACVTQHLMNRSDCFFCKTTIQRVTDQATNSTLYQAEANKTAATHK